MSAPASAPTVLKKPKSAKPKIPANHPPVIDMLKASIIAAKDRKGTSLPTIKKFIAANYKVDVEQLGPYIRRGTVHAVEKGTLVLVGNKGKGASGSFKVAEKKAAVAKLKSVKKPKVVKAKKPEAPKKPKATKKPAKPKTKTSSKPKAAKKPMTSLATRRNILSYVSRFEYVKSWTKLIRLVAWLLKYKTYLVKKNEQQNTSLTVNDLRVATKEVSGKFLSHSYISFSIIK
ncbi:linker histone H1 and H5 family protein [Opisthorchis viverrini]|uniref:Linker histone H1 and H5 family protein n=1 Tax=Opisthorchis viverrini TaxID=6198 RepID=A0A1S8WTW0_OPIVI|nr:linker histone H1 and H5 family protein [Opisthorchis viverrini]